MRSILLATCAAAIVATAAVGASAGQSAAPGAIIRVDDNRYYDDGYYDDRSYNDGGYQYQDNGYYDSGPGWSNSAYGQPVSPRWIVRNLQRSDYRYISRPILSGRFYQVKAVNPNGKKVKLWIDAYSGQIVKVKGKG